jgi:hypothetical protein
MKVRIKKVPKARTGYQVHGALANDVPAMGGADYDSYIGIPDPKFNRTLKKVPREQANLEAEGNETVMMNTGNIPAFYTIKGPRHAQGGVPLNLPDDSFIYSDFREMKLKDPELLAKFGKSIKGGKTYTPAELSKQYDINKYRQILQDPNSDAIDKKTAETMIRNYNMKLGALALAQEAKKGFPQGIPAVAKPFMEANGLSEADFVPPQEEEEAATEPGLEAQGEEMMAEEGQAPQTMPDGSPIAMPQGEPMSEQGMPPMQYGGYPMAMYGMNMGGYDMPYYPDQMAYGGVPRYQAAGETVKGKTGNVTATQVSTLPKKGTAAKTASGKDAEIVYEAGAERTYKGGKAIPGGTKVSPGWAKSMCDRLMEGATIDKLVEEGHGTKEGLTDLLKDCIPKAEEKFKEREVAYYIEPESVNEQECECTYPDGTTERMPKNADGTCPPCKKEIEEEVTGDYGAEIPMAMGDGYAPWWLQDTVNTMGAFGDLASINKYMPWAASVDLEEPRPTFLDPTRELAAQSEQANIAAQASGAFAGNAQQMGARLANIQGQGAAGAANTLSNINNQNVGIANQFEGQQIGIRNQEQLMNQQIANDLYDKNVIANQQFDNAKRQAMANLRQQYNTALTNRAKTDALNQLYPNYQVDPSSGGFMGYTPTEKTVNPIQDKDVIRYAQQLEAAGLTKEERAVLLKEYVRSNSGATTEGPDPNVIAQMYGQRGGLMKNGGYVYSDILFPFIM